VVFAPVQPMEAADPMEMGMGMAMGMAMAMVKRRVRSEVDSIT
jgi:hypothetical protein